MKVGAGNRGAARGEYSEKTERINVPVDAAQAKAAKRQAKLAGVSLSEWIRGLIRIALAGG